MSSVDKNLLSFLNWLTAVMDEKNVVPADIARTGLVTDSAISLLLSGKTKSVLTKKQAPHGVYWAAIAKGIMALPTQ